MILNDTDHLNWIMDHDMLNGPTIWTDSDDNDYLNEIMDPNQPNGITIWTDFEDNDKPNRIMDHTSPNDPKHALKLKKIVFKFPI